MINLVFFIIFPIVLIRETRIITNDLKLNFSYFGSFVYIIFNLAILFLDLAYFDENKLMTLAMNNLFAPLLIVILGFLAAYLFFRFPLYIWFTRNKIAMNLILPSFCRHSLPTLLILLLWIVCLSDVSLLSFKKENSHIEILNQAIIICLKDGKISKYSAQGIETLLRYDKKGQAADFNDSDWRYTNRSPIGQELFINEKSGEKVRASLFTPFGSLYPKHIKQISNTSFIFNLNEDLIILSLDKRSYFNLGKVELLGLENSKKN